MGAVDTLSAAPSIAAPRIAAARRRRLDLDAAKGIAILLVVSGHIVATTPPDGVQWYDTLRYALYRFHMPFFLYLSGYVAGLTGVLSAPPAGWPRLVRKRAARLLPPFLLVGLLILAGKLAAMQLAFVDNAPNGLWGGLASLFWHTANSPATSVWYLLVLFIATVAALPVVRLAGTTGLLLAFLALQPLPVPPVMYLDRFASHAVFFALGAWVAMREDQLLPLFGRWLGLWWLAFLASLVAAVAGLMGPRLALLVCGTLAVPALHGLVRTQAVARLRWPLWLGGYSMVIYLFNTIAIGMAKAALLLAGIGWTAAGFWLHAPLLMLAGVALPILGKQLVLRHVPPLDRMTD